MGFKDDYIFKQLKHEQKFYNKKLLSDESLFNLLWYFICEQSYIQKIEIFNNIFDKKSSPYDNFFMIWLYNELSLSQINIYSAQNKLNEELDSFSINDIEKNLVFIYTNEKTLFNSFFEKMRNSIAHGTFNLSNRFFLIGQNKNKITSPINFYFQTKCNIYNKFNEMLESLSLMKSINELCESALKCSNNIIEKDGILYFNEKQVIIEHNFKLKSVKKYGLEISQIKKLINDKAYNNVLIILCCVIHCNLNDEILTSKNVEVISYTNIYSFFNYNIFNKK